MAQRARAVAARGAAPDFAWTPKQEEALRLLGGPAHHTMLFGGARSGKTFVLTAATVTRAVKVNGSRHAIFRHRFNHLKISIALDTFPKVMKLRFPDVPYTIDRTDWFARIGESEIWFAGLDEKERTEKILGQEFATLYFNECSQIAYSSILMARTRLAQNTALRNRAYYDCNPPGSKHWTSMIFQRNIDPSSKPAGQPLPNPEIFASLKINPADNAANLKPETLEELRNLPKAQRERFFHGNFSAELDNALWTMDSFRQRMDEIDVGDFERIVVAVDPSGASGSEDKRSDEIGIIVAGKRHDGRYVVIADRTMRGAPHQWARAVMTAYNEFEADSIVAEANFGGAMVEATIRAEAPYAPIRIVKASKSKAVRAEPIAALYGLGLVDHCIGLDALEDQMLNMTTAGYMGDKSPDRADAMVWALFDLSGRIGKRSFTVI